MRISDWSSDVFSSDLRLFLVLTGKVQQQLKDVDEVQIERERAEHSHLGAGFLIMMGGIFAFKPLGVPGGEASEHEYAVDRDRELQRRWAQTQIDQASDHHANQAHDKKCAEPSKLALG